MATSTDPSPARCARMLALIERYRDQVDQEVLDVLDLARRYLLVEEATGPSGRTWLTTHATTDDAAAYWENQEGREYWEPGVLWDVATGDELHPVVTLTFEVAQHAVLPSLLGEKAEG